MLDGGLGNDTYVFGRNSGADTINSLDTTVGRIDTLQLGPGIVTGDVVLTRVVDDLIVTIRGTSDVIRIRNHFVGNSAGGNQIDLIRFNDTTTWNTAEIQARLTIANHSPVVNAPIADQSLTQGATFNLTVPASSFSDPDAGDTLAYSATLADGNPLPSWLTFTPSTRTFSGNSTTASPGISSIRVTAIDSGGLSVSDVFDLLVQLPSGYVLTGTTGNDFISAGVLNDTLYGLAGDDVLYGGPGRNIVYGQEGNDQLSGGGGLDTLVGGVGNDTYYADADDLVVEAAGEGYDYAYALADYVMAPNVEWLYLQGTATHATGNAQDNTILTNALSFAGFYLDGGGGVDTMYGALGNDTFVVDNAADVVVEYSTVGDGTTTWENTGVDTVLASVSYDLAWNVENLVLTGTAAINGTGNGQVNTITGNPGANVLAGVGANDTLIGGGGDDTYIVADASTTLVEQAGGGIDTVASSIEWTLGSQLENLTLTGGAQSGTGNASANVLTGNAQGRPARRRRRRRHPDRRPGRRQLRRGQRARCRHRERG